MFIYKFFAFIIKIFSLLLFLGIVFCGLYLVVSGADMALSVGELWYFEHHISLAQAQVIIERYIYQPLWFGVVVPYILEQAAYIVFPMGIIVSGVFSYLLFRVL